MTFLSLKTNHLTNRLHHLNPSFLSEVKQKGNDDIRDQLMLLVVTSTKVTRSLSKEGRSDI